MTETECTYFILHLRSHALVSDRYVLVGNHRDAWVFGALDPSSGTATMMEMSRVMGNMVKSGAARCLIHSLIHTST